MDGKGKEWRGPAGERVSEQCFTPPPTQYRLYCVGGGSNHYTTEPPYGWLGGVVVRALDS